MKVYSYETRVNACAAYLLGEPIVAIAQRYGIKEPSLIIYWIRKRGCFKTRQGRQRNS